MADFHCILDPVIAGELLYRDPAINLNYPIHNHLGGLFNSFYPYDWLKITGSKSFKITIKGTAHKARISIFLHTPNAPPQTVKQLDAALTADGIKLILADLSPSPGQRLTCQIESASPIDLSAVSWTAITNNEREVKLGIVICTYNNEARLKQNIQELTASRVWHEQQPILILANNGKIKDDSWFPQERFFKFDQKNLGGSGGFGRGIYAALYGELKDIGISHILLMDDDVKFHPEVINRAIAFHKKSEQPAAIGGSMLKLDDPTWLHEAGANLNSTGGIGTSTDVPKGPIKKTGVIDYLGRGLPYDYNAWWFFSFPVDAVRVAGLPLPIFIHGDDIEYGLRLNSCGYRVYCPGGISLWHESFENKHPTWIRYFDFRNALIRLSFHYDNSPKAIIRQLKQVCKRALIRNDYGGYIMALKAFEDFCKGPQILYNNDFAAQIKALDDLYHDYSQADSTGRYKFANVSIACQKKKKVRRIIKHLTANLHALPVPSIKHFKTNNTRFSWTDVPYLADITVQLPSGKLVHYHRNIGKYKSLKKRLRTNLETSVQEIASAQKAWRDERKVFHSEAFWKQYTSSENET